MKFLVGLCLVFCIAGVSWADEAAPLDLEDPSNPVAVIETSRGRIFVELFAKEAPKTVENFLGLAEGTKAFKDAKTGEMVERPYYDGLIFHRVIVDFMIQGGCPQGTGMGSPGFKFEDEINATALGLDKELAVPEFDPPQGRVQLNPMVTSKCRTRSDFQRLVMQPIFQRLGIQNDEELKERFDEVAAEVLEVSVKTVLEAAGYRYRTEGTSHHPKRGVIAMANTGANTNGSQFFINLIDTVHLTGQHTVFGRVVEGMDVVDTIGKVPVGPNSKPEEDVKILSVRRLEK